MGPGLFTHDVLMFAPGRLHVAQQKKHNALA